MLLTRTARWQDEPGVVSVTFFEGGIFMKRIALAALVSGLAIAAATPASAAIFIGVQLGNGAITQVASDTLTPGSANYNTLSGVGGYQYNVGATGSPLLTAPTLFTQSINVVQGDPGTRANNSTLTIYITQTDLPSFSGLYKPSFTANSFDGSALSVMMSVFESPSNALWTGNLIASATFTPTSSPNGQSFPAGQSFTGLFSQTAMYKLTFGNVGQGAFNDTINIQGTAVPETATWGMMLFGFGLLGATLRRRSVGARIRFA